MTKGTDKPRAGRVGHLLMGLFLFSGLLLPGGVGAETSDNPLLFSLFKSLISTTDSKRCSHVPSCARYAKDAVTKHGPVKGLVLSCDRLIRCGGNDTERLPQVVVGGERYAWDPVSSNDFWWGSNETLKKKGTPPVLPLHFKGWD
ncbi:membrane protein insertion efficiency factor YidD [Desulfoluna sp.]|uniref:membrane protein insertion efficiency factor YidD n=1 Tax=Desulfoluna sp. TaxID=2045199 RepID=UPI002613D56E|nr:membrane protein insertion efficiency factor YidD [Desulfoluna sp.]